MKKLALLVSVGLLATACQTVEGIGNDISNIDIDMPEAPKMAAAPASNPNAGEKKGAYKEPQQAAANETEVDIKRDFPSYHTAPRFDQEPAAGK